MKPLASRSARFCASLALVFTLGLTAAPMAQAVDVRYQQRNLVSDGSSPAEHTDPNLVNSWGVAFNPFGFVWVANAGSGTSTLYDGDGNPQSLVVQIPSPSAATGGAPTGIVFNASAGFVVNQGGPSGPSRFIFATLQGVIAGWAPNVNLLNAVRAVDNSASGAVYTGLALSASGNGQLLYAANIARARVDVFDSTFNPVTLPAGAFTDPRIPTGFAPFGIHAIGGNLYVTYAKPNPAGPGVVRGAGLGYVNVFTPNGQLIRRVASSGSLNAPWGVALAPAAFGTFSNALLIGNFGDGRINAYEPVFNLPLGPLRDRRFRPIQINGLWGLAFGNGFANHPVNTLFFAAGPDNGLRGQYGRLDVIP